MSEIASTNLAKAIQKLIQDSQPKITGTSNSVKIVADSLSFQINKPAATPVRNNSRSSVR